MYGYNPDGCVQVTNLIQKLIMCKGILAGTYKQLDGALQAIIKVISNRKMKHTYVSVVIKIEPINTVTSVCHVIVILSERPSCHACHNM